MKILVSYDVSTVTTQGRRRLRRVAKKCVGYGIRVQNSVFECSLDAATWERMKADLIDLIDPDQDSLRFYYLGNNWKRRVEHVGAKPSVDLRKDALIV